MKTLAIDFRRPARWPTMARAVAAVLALALCGAALREHLAYRAALLEWEAARERAEAAAEPALLAAGADGEQAARLRQAVAARASLAADWAGLLDSLEAVPMPEVAMLSLHADVATGALAIEAAARGPASMQAYVAALGHAGALARVHLVSQQDGRQGDIPALRFAVQAHWRATGQGAP